MEEGTVFGDIEACLTRNLCECILYFHGEICGIPENVPRFLKNAFHIPEERHFEGLLSVTDEVLVNCLVKLVQEKSVVSSS